MYSKRYFQVKVHENKSNWKFEGMNSKINISSSTFQGPPLWTLLAMNLFIQENKKRDKNTLVTYRYVSICHTREHRCKFRESDNSFLV